MDIDTLYSIFLFQFLPYLLYEIITAPPCLKGQDVKLSLCMHIDVMVWYNLKWCFLYCLFLHFPKSFLFTWIERKTTNDIKDGINMIRYSILWCTLKDSSSTLKHSLTSFLLGLILSLCCSLSKLFSTITAINNYNSICEARSLQNFPLNHIFTLLPSKDFPSFSLIIGCFEHFYLHNISALSFLQSEALMNAQQQTHRHRDQRRR